MRHYPPNKNLITTTVIVNGHPYSVSKKCYYSVLEVVTQAIKETKNDPSRSWQIKNANGEPVNTSISIGDYCDDIIFVTLPPGVGA